MSNIYCSRHTQSHSETCDLLNWSVCVYPDRLRNGSVIQFSHVMCENVLLLVGWLVMEILNSQTLTPADICTFADGNWSLIPHHLSQYLHLLFIFAEFTGRKKRLQYWHILRSDSVFPVVLNQLPLGSERLEWVSSPLLKDVKTSALRQ